MRKNREPQRPLAPLWPDHRLSDELQTISQILDENPKILELLLQDLSDKADPQNGSPGRSVEQILRIAVLKNWHQLSYQKLAFHLADSQSFRAFCRLPWGWAPGKSCLQENLCRIQASTWEGIGQILLQWAQARGLEGGKKIRGDATTVPSPIRHPLDSQLLYDGVRTVTALLRELKSLQGVSYRDHCRRAKRRVTNLRNARGKARKAVFYRDLLKVARKTRHYGELALGQVCEWEDCRSLVIAEKLRHYLPLLQKVMDQTERRILRGESVAAEEKIVSLFEEHSDIIYTGGRETLFGHKVYVTCGKSSLILDAQVVKGNPADQSQMKPMLRRHFEHYGFYPRQASFGSATVFL